LTGKADLQSLQIFSGNPDFFSCNSSKRMLTYIHQREKNLKNKKPKNLLE